jgi:hypothetical protein
MFLMDFFKSHHKCQHEHIPIDVQYAYCPDCGELIENEWFITRCAFCGIKHKAIIKNGEIIPEGNFCRNCGGDEYIVEKLEKINFIDINYAVLVKTVVQEEPVMEDVTQCWEEKSTNIPKLLQLFQ